MDRILIIMKKNNGHQGIICSFTGAFSIICKHVYLYNIQQISGERLQDHWSSGTVSCRNVTLQYLTWLIHCEVS